jgi:hypothetical protein
MTSTPATVRGTEKPVEMDANAAQITLWSTTYKLTTDEIARLNSVLVAYAPDEVAAELNEELRCIIAARKLAIMPDLTAIEIERARAAFESGQTPFVPQDAD